MNWTFPWNLGLHAAMSCVLFLLAGCMRPPAHHDQGKIAERKAVAFLSREVPAWSRENGCFSCHNNGDAARALFAASAKGHHIEDSALADTLRWLTQPERWDDNKGDPGFSDKRLANLQFAAALGAAIESGHVADRNPLRIAARRVAADQGSDGGWTIDAQSMAGSPATYGSVLATHMALGMLEASGSEPTAAAKAVRWLENAKPMNVLEAAALVMRFARATNHATLAKMEQSLAMIRRAQGNEGGWGPFPDTPAEPFDTAVVLLALAEVRSLDKVEAMIAGGRRFLISEQNADGSWPATTRPRGGESYAQQLSTTGWATLALLKTRP
ncbi:MAG: terpene cyclase/mutase family protein [Verrucomicrobia subdivision 3 bacterium]|nr:terpene cyclase/mutase family protein [Limisphaerales bacterium]